MTAEQRLKLVSYWFSGREQELPYEEWGPRRPGWIPDP
jgi:hypothetical protein